MPYAEKTKVAPERSRVQIERLLARAGSTDIAVRTNSERTAIGFDLGGRMIRMVVALPDETDRAITHTPGGRPRGAADRSSALAQEVRQRWRALHLCVQAKLAAVEAGIETVEEAFLPYIILPDGRTVHEHVAPAVERAYVSGETPPLLTFGGDE